MNKQDNHNIMIDSTNQPSKIPQVFQKNKKGIEYIKKYLLQKTENRYKLHLSDEQAFKWKFNKSSNSRPLSSFKLLRKQPKQQSNSSQITIEDLKSYNFPVLSFTNKELAYFAKIMLQNNQYFQQTIKNKEFLSNLITQISLNYNIVSYHNFSHAFSLSLMLFQCFNYHQDLSLYYSEQEKFYAVLAGLAHDLNHRGTNNAYQVKMKTKLAQDFDNVSVLENFHLRQFWRILQKNPHLDFLKMIKNPIQTKKRIIFLILMTDVAHHFKNLEKLKQLKNEANNKNENFFKSEENKQFFLGQIFHACDIGNPCVDFNNYITWAALLSYEFNQQTKLQKQNQVEVTEMLRYKDLTNFYKGQLGFINFLVMPLWKEISEICSNLKIFTNNINQNIQILNHKIETAKQEDQIIQDQKI